MTTRIKLFQLYMGGHINGPDFRVRNSPLSERVQALSQQLAEAEIEVRSLEQVLLDTDRTIEQVQSDLRDWPDLDPVAKKNLLQTLIDSVTLDQDQIRIIANLQRQKHTALQLASKREITLPGDRKLFFQRLE